ncbi:hypothetical protein DVQ19_04495 [Yersinia enterocolitica]|nr:hypothetical protein [Yersinia enterocolitica]EKN5126830.1 hypothetical protein [Yersinia enterocolitica]EKN5927456.1 hypothetical protein [Yersinia enterocolitica]EKN5949054.1 hypothetical protein [Yersinia enterocolitica]EKN5980270.1 hypothetical protein [Yersinia enterocolitica]
MGGISGVTPGYLDGSPILFIVHVSGIRNPRWPYPVVLIDESQDTHAPVMEAFLKVQQLAQTRFCLGLLGDTMQQIYVHGVTVLAVHSTNVCRTNLAHCHRQ